MRIAVLIVCCSFFGCATLFKGGPDRIPVNSEPTGAGVFLNGSKLGITPMDVYCERSEDCKIDVRKEGYVSRSEERKKRFNAIMLLDVIVWPTLIVDLATSNQGKRSERPLSISLEPLEEAKGPAPASQ